jgi:uncharacterized circularly permuted ATP-grasp superfamily protein/uncharacterized alpha-E superfamily protein
VAPVNGYSPISSPWDELRAGPDSIRPHWEQVWAAIEGLGSEGLATRRASLDRLLRDEGVTYKSPEDAAVRRAWELDPVPFLVDSQGWRAIEAGLVQRAELLDLVLSDLYGPRDLLRRGLLPAELVWAHPGFLRPCTGIALPGPQQLVLLAADLARDASGRVRVLADRAQMPVGIGYAVMNRLVMSRVFPSLYRDAQVHRLSLFLRRLRAALAEVAPVGVHDPRVVILTPGPASPTYFEHAFLASQLGYPLVEGEDLVVRHGGVWIRSVVGPERVDVIVRRVDADDLDPLELDPDSELGVPGLVEAARRGTVSIVNPPGTGVLEHPALGAFLPRIAEHYLGQPLQIDGPETWWCGHPTDRAHVLAHLGSVLVKHADGRAGHRTLFGGDLSRAELDELRARIELSPHLWVGQECLDPSTVPTLVDGRLVPRPVTVRAFLVAHRGSYEPMAGGLVRVATGDGRDPGTGRLSKDAWVISSEPDGLAAPPVEAWAAEVVVALPGRAAEHMFAIGRQAERAEVAIRVLNTVLGRLDQAEDEHDATQVLGGLVDALAVLTGAPGGAGVSPEMIGAPGGGAGPGAASVPERALDALLDPDRPGSVVVTLRALVDAAFSVQEQLSGDTWKVIADVEGHLAGLAKRPPETLLAAQADLTDLTRSLLAIAGLTVESMVRDTAWRFLDGGRRLERGLALVSILRTTLVPAHPPEVETLLLESVLKAFESIIDYRRRFRGPEQVRAALEQLLFDPDNPRSLRYQLDRLAEDLAGLPRANPLRRLNPEERWILDASTALQLADPADLAAVDPAAGRRATLDEFLLRLSELLGATTEVLGARYFTRPPIARLAESRARAVTP